MNDQAKSNKVASTAHIDWGLVAAIIAILQATIASTYQLVDANLAGSGLKKFVFGFGTVMGILAALGASCALYKKLQGNEARPQIGAIVLLGLIAAAILFPLIDLFAA